MNLGIQAGKRLLNCFHSLSTAEIDLNVFLPGKSLFEVTKKEKGNLSIDSCFPLLLRKKLRGCEQFVRVE